MADDQVDSDSYAGSKRRTTFDAEQEEETLFQLQLLSPLSEITTLHHHQEETALDDSSPKKKLKCSSLLSEVNQELGLQSSTENVSLSGSFEKEQKDNVRSKEGFFGVQEVDTQVNAIEIDGGSVLEASKKEHLGTCLEFEEKRAIKGKALDSENVLEAEKKRLLGELELGNIFGAKTCTGHTFGSATDSSKIDDGKKIDGIKGLDLPIRSSLKVEVIDDTALIESFPLSKTGNGSVKDEKKKKGNQEIDGKKAKRSRRKGKNAKKVLGEAERNMELTKIVVVQNGRKESNTQSKRMYSREDLEALRFAKVVEQRKIWMDMYNGLGAAVIKEYEDLAIWKHQKNISLSADTHHCFGRKAESPAIMREDYFENVDNELKYMEDNGTENVYSLHLTCTHDVGDEDAFIDVEEECIEDDNSDEDYTSILRPAFIVEGEPDFDSGPPEDGLEYLRRVRWQAAQIPKVTIAKPDRTKWNEEQSVYMPQIPEIAKCPEHLLPLKQWEEAFLADFSELRLTLSHLEYPSVEISCKLPMFTVQEDNLYQLPERGVEKCNNLTTSEVLSDGTSLSNATDTVILLSHQNLSAKTSVSDTCDDYPALSAIQKMDSVARVSMLRKRISSVETMASLSRSNCMWLFALCAAVDTPLDADSCASLRSLLRKCASLRAQKSEADDEVVMLNILATIAGRYFGQSET
ncbi:Gemin2/Brr1 - like 1 [Theobroma cacao]|nr:Gemin2/Brr1 - like 1 [Theobroma cacao]